MKKIKTAELLENLEADTRKCILQINYLLQQDPEVLLKQPGEGKWSVAQVIEHLNSYGRYYLPIIERSLINPRYASTEFYKPGWLGDYFTKSMLPKRNGQVTNKMQAPAAHRPSVDVDSRKVLEDFLQQEYLLLQLLDKAGTTNLERIRISISISRFIKIKLGDTFRFLIAHHQRHFVQVENTLKVVRRLNTPVSLLYHELR